MADEQSKLNKLIAAGATPEELAQTRAEDKRGVLLNEQAALDAAHGHRRRLDRGILPSMSQTVHREAAERKAAAAHRKAMQQRSQDIQKYGEEQDYWAKMNRMKQEAQEAELERQQLQITDDWAGKVDPRGPL